MAAGEGPSAPDTAVAADAGPLGAAGSRRDLRASPLGVPLGTAAAAGDGRGRRRGCPKPPGVPRRWPPWRRPWRHHGSACWPTAAPSTAHRDPSGRRSADDRRTAPSPPGTTARPTPIAPGIDPRPRRAGAGSTARPPALAPDQPRLPQDLEVLRARRLGQCRLPSRPIVSTQLRPSGGLHQLPHDRQPHGVGQRVQDVERRGCCRSRDAGAAWLPWELRRVEALAAEGKLTLS